MEQTRCMQAHIQERTETTRASQWLEIGAACGQQILRLAKCREKTSRRLLWSAGHMPKVTVRKRAGPMNCGLSGWSVRKKKAGAPFSQAGGSTITRGEPARETGGQGHSR